jgi:hypothetical protein
MSKAAALKSDTNECKEIGIDTKENAAEPKSYVADCKSKPIEYEENDTVQCTLPQQWSGLFCWVLIPF